MAARSANVQGVNFFDGPLGSEKGGVAWISFNLINLASTGGSDTISLGGGGYDGGASSTDSLATMLQKRRRDGKTVTLTAVGGCVSPGAQGSTLLYPQSGTIGSGNITGITLNTAATGGSSASSTTSTWDRDAMIAVSYTAV